MKTQPIIITLLICLFISSYGVIHAQTASPSATPNSDRDTQINQDIIERAKNRQTAQVQGTSTQKTFGLIGTLAKSVGSSLQIKTVTGAIRLVELDKNATLLRLGKSITKEELELESPVLVMGYMDGQQGYSGRRLLLTDASIFSTPRKTTLGFYKESTTRQLTLNVQKEGGTSSEKISLTSKTQFLDNLGNVIKRTDLVPNDKLVVVLPEGDTATVSALRIHSLTTKPKAVSLGQ